MVPPFPLITVVGTSYSFSYAYRKCANDSFHFLWVVFAIVAAMGLFHTADAFEVPVIKEGLAKFELSPLPASLDQVGHRALNHYAFILNDDGRPFSMGPDGRIVLVVRLLSYDVNAYSKYIESFLLPTITEEYTPRRLFFMLTQPRLHCLNTQRLASPVCNTTESTEVNEASMKLETRLMVKIFELSQWQSLLKRLLMDESMKYANVDDFTSADQVSLHRFYSGEASLLCGIPSGHTIYLEADGTNDFSGIVWHRQHRTRVIAVLIQCSNVPLTVGVSLKMFNGDEGRSLEYLSTEMVNLVFLVAYLALLVTLLLLILPNCCSYYPNVAARPTHSVERETSNRTFNNYTIGTTDTGVRNSNDRSVNNGKEVNRVDLRDTNSDGDRVGTDDVWNIDEGEANNSEMQRQATHSSLWTKMRNICGRKMFILHPALQWLVLVCICIRMIVCALRVAQYHYFSASVNVSLNGSIGVLAGVLTVCTRSVIFAMQQFVCVGWGCAYRCPPTAKVAIATLTSILGFSVFVLQSTCEGSTMKTTFALLDYFASPATVRCVTINAVCSAVDLIGSVLNIFQLTTLMATIGLAASTGNVTGKASVFNDNVLLYLRYRGMCVPYALGIILPQIVFIAFSESRLSFDDFYLAAAMLEYLQWFPLTFVLLFLRKDPLFF